MPVTPIPFLIAALAIVGTSVALWISQTLELVPRCNVYLEGCISISAAGRHAPAVHAFRATIIPHGTLLMVVWPLTVLWLRDLTAGTLPVRRAILAFGGLSPLFLIWYVVGLGEDGVWIEEPRLIVIRVFFVMTLVAQVLTSTAVLRHSRMAAPGAVPHWLAALLLGVAAGTFAVAAASVPLEFALEDPSVAHNLMQWYASTVYLVWFLLLWLAWRQSGFTRLEWPGPTHR